MANTIFNDYSPPAINAAWLNDINRAIYVLMGDGVNAPVNRSDVLTNLGFPPAIGTIVSQNANNVAITGGSITGIADLAIADGGTGASTAAAALVNLGVGPVGFFAHANGGAQAFPSGSFTVVTTGTEIFDSGNYFSSNAWTPPSGRPVTMSGSVSFIPTVANVGTHVIAIFKNGVEFARGQIGPFGTNTIPQGCTVSAVDLPNGTDVYTLRAFQNNAASINSTGAIPNTYFCGMRA